MTCSGNYSNEKRLVFLDTLIRLFYISVAKDDFDMVSMLTSVRDIALFKTVTGMNPLYFARSAKMVDLLISSGADPWSPTNKDKITPAMAAAYRGDHEVIAALLRHSETAGRDITKDFDRFGQNLVTYMMARRRTC